MTLEKCKGYGLEERTQSLLDASRSKIEGPIPHQASQRERVSMAALPLSKQDKRAARRRQHHKRWPEMLHPDKRMGVPQLMMLLEPNVVWDHTRAFVEELGVDVESQYGKGNFFEGWHKAGRYARGVYEGSYWELIGDCDNMAEMLRSMSQAPPLMEEVPIELPEQAELPKWDDYKPILQVLPSAPTLPVLRIPPFRAPILETELPFVEPELIPLPEVPEQPHEEATPQFEPPELVVLDAFEEEEFVPIEPPTIPAAPVAPKIGKPKHGYDWLRMSKADGRVLPDDEFGEEGSWVGAHPYQKDEPLYVPPKLLDLPTWKHPPRPLPKLPLADNLELDEADVELEPIPKLELAWDCGPDPEPAYASISTTPATMSRATTPVHSRPSSAGPGSYIYPSPQPSRPASALHHLPLPQQDPSQQQLPQRPSTVGSPSRPSSSSRRSSNTPTPKRPLSAQKQPQQQQQQQHQPPFGPALERLGSACTPPGSRPQSGRPAAPSPVLAPEQIHPAAPLFPDKPDRKPSNFQSKALSAIQSPRGLSPQVLSRSPSVQDPAAGSVQGDLDWESTVSSLDAGKPHVWLNFNKPFADLPPVFMPNRPELGACNGPEPVPEDFGPSDLEELPEFVVPEQLPLPTWEAPPPPKTSQWMPPTEPRPVGFMRGTAPVIIMDVSGTMNPAQRGKVNEVKACVCELLHPDGELGTASGLFDVIAFCNQSWAWSATYAQRLSLLSSTQVQYTGRQVGGKILPGSARAANKAKSGAAQLMPTEPELLADARNWVDKWPGAVGHTNMLSSYLMADSYWNTDCWYLFSDGLADDPNQCLDFLESRAKHGHRCPRVHAVGFFPYEAPENFEGRRFLKKVAEITNGTYQEYDAKLHRIYQEGVGFVSYDIKGELPENTIERHWAEEQLRAERKKNIRLGIVERLDVTMARVQALHNQTRVQPQLVEYNEREKAGQAQYEREMEEVVAQNAARKQQAMDEYMAHLNAVSQSNQDKIDAANARYQAAHHEWMESYHNALREWEALKMNLEQERADAITHYQALQAARSRTPSPPRSRPVSAQAPPMRRDQPSRSQPQSAKSGLRDPAPRPVSASGTPRDPDAALVPYPAPVQAQIPPAAPPPLDMSALYAKPEEETYPAMNSERVMAAFAQATTSVWDEGAEPQSFLPQGDDNTVTMEDAIRGSITQRDSNGSPFGSSPHLSGQQQQPYGAQQTVSASGRPPSARSRLGSESSVHPALQQGRPLSAGPSPRALLGRPASAGPASRTTSARPTSAGQAGPSQQQKASLQQLIEEGEGADVEEVVSIDGEPSNLSVAGEVQQLQCQKQSGQQQTNQQEQAQLQQKVQLRLEQQQQQQQQQQRPGSSSSVASTQRSMQQPPQQQAPHAQASELDDGFVVEEDGEGLDYLGEMPPLELEDSQELKRRIFPADIVKALDDENAERLSALRGEWESLLLDTAARNARKLAALATNKTAVENYISDVLKVYASTFVRDVVMGRCVKAVTNERLTKAAESAHAAECERIRAENALTADLHTQEIGMKRQKEAQFKQAVERWHKRKADAWATYEQDAATARKLHNENIARMRAEWETKHAEVETLNQNRMKQAEALHLRLVEDVTAINRRLAMEHASKVEQRKALEDQNRMRIAEAKVMHKAKLQQQAIANEERLSEAQREHQALCTRMTEGHASACIVAQKEFEELRAFLAAHNDSMLEAARQKYAAAVAAAQAEWEVLCAQLREEHEEAMALAREHNKQVWPQVLVARLAQEELGRVMAFAEHIKFCANKLQLGVNFMPNTPCYERVVEMQALNEALIMAFPEFDPNNYPWPDYEQKLQPGTGWVASPEAKSIDIKDPTILIMELAAGKRAAAAAIAASMPRGATIAGHTASSAAKAVSGTRPRSATRPFSAASPVHLSDPGKGGMPRWLLQQQEWSPKAQQWIQQQERPASAGGRLPASAAPQGVPATVAEVEEEGEQEEEGAGTSNMSRPSTAPSATRPLSARRFRFAGTAPPAGAKPTRPWSAHHPHAHPEPSCVSAQAGPQSVVPRLRIPNTSNSLTASPSPQNSMSGLPTASAYYQQSIFSGAATAPGSPHEHQRRTAWQPSPVQPPGAPQVRALSAGPTLTPPSALASAPSMMQFSNRPVSGLSMRQPKTSSKAMPARMAIDLAAMQATVNLHRSRKAPFEAKAQPQGPRTKQQAFTSNNMQSLYSGFRADFPKAQFPQVDVRALGDLQ